MHLLLAFDEKSNDTIGGWLRVFGDGIGESGYWFMLLFVSITGCYQVQKLRRQSISGSTYELKV